VCLCSIWDEDVSIVQSDIMYVDYIFPVITAIEKLSSSSVLALWKGIPDSC